MKSRVVWVVVLFVLITAVLSFKDKAAIYAVNKALSKYAPGSIFYAKDISLWPGYARLQNFGIKNIKNSSPALNFTGQKALFKFSLFALFKGDLSAIDKAEAAVSSLSYDVLELEDTRIAF